MDFKKEIDIKDEPVEIAINGSFEEDPKNKEKGNYPIEEIFLPENVKNEESEKKHESGHRSSGSTSGEYEPTKILKQMMLKYEDEVIKESENQKKFCCLLCEFENDHEISELV
ncbi:hypothetical protein Avbf_13895 [Armadillidium vulgare]|nr:hypothetical protein Avbf_13895 [Armadillidium vulgare]